MRLTQTTEVRFLFSFYKMTEGFRSLISSGYCSRAGIHLCLTTVLYIECKTILLTGNCIANKN